MRTTVKKNIGLIKNRLNPIILVKKAPVIFTDNIYKHPRYKRWRKSVFIRDHFLCQLCLDPKHTKIEAHHIKKKSQYPELIFEVNNGITLCLECHEKVTGFEKQFEKALHDIIVRKREHTCITNSNQMMGSTAGMP